MRLSWSLLVALIALTGCIKPEVQLGLAGDISPLTGGGPTLQPVPMMPAWRKVLFEGELAGGGGKELGHPGFDFQSDKVAVGTGAGWFHCFRASDGEQLWRIRLTGDGAPVFHNGQILTGTGDGEVVALNAGNGDVDWRYSVGGAVTRAPVVGGNLVYFVDGTNALYAVNRKDGAWRWQYRRAEPADFALVGEARPVLHEGLVYVGFSDGSLVALDAATGAERWTRDLAPEAERFQDVDADPLIIGDTLYAASASGGLYALNPKTGDVRWTAPVTGIVGLQPFDGDLIVSLDHPAVFRLSARTGKVQWRTRFDIEQGAPTRPVINDDIVAVNMTRGGLHFLRATDGRPIQHFDPGSGFQSAPAFGIDSSVYVLSNGGIFYALRPRG